MKLLSALLGVLLFAIYLSTAATQIIRAFHP